MNIVSALQGRAQRLRAWVELDVESVDLPSSAARLSDESVVEALADVAALASDVARLEAVLAGVLAQRSRHEHGHTGLAAVHGHATPAAFVQSITGGTRADATRHVRVGEALVTDAPAVLSVPTADDPKAPWHEPLRRALLDGEITAEQHDSIKCGLGEPIASTAADQARDAATEAWSLAAEDLVAEARSGMPVEEIGKRARTIRDMLDPVGAEDRLSRRYDRRSFHMWVDAEGQHRARVAFDDEMALWVRSVLDAALRPRRGGPRFVDEGDRAAAEDLVGDERTNDQLQYDLVMDVLRAGSLASAGDVFGTRQPGVRLLVVKDAAGPRDAFGRLVTVGHAEDGGDALPGSVIDRALCMHGSLDVNVDAQGNPLDLGREQRLYSPRQRVALAVRDGGCLWPGCARSASYCEAHHCDHFVEHGGRTDIDRGVLLCRFHHMLLHNRGWRIGRDGRGPFVLHRPPGEGPPIVLDSKAVWKRAWDPPPPPERKGWRAA